MKRVVCYSHGHLGDCILVLPFINYIKNFISQNVIFKNDYHSKKIFKNYGFKIESLDYSCDKNLDIYEHGESIYINLWFGICGRDTIIPEDHKDDFSKLIFILLNNSLKKYNWEIDRNYLNDTDSFFLNDYKSNLKNITSDNSVLIYNQKTYSGQGCNINYDYVIKYLLSNTSFSILTTKKSSATHPRVTCLEDSVEELDLSDIASCTYNCNYFIGPLNATIISSWTKTNLLDSKKKYIIESNCDHRSYNENQKCSFNYVLNSEHLMEVINDKFIQRR